MWELQLMRLETIGKRLVRDSMLLFIGFCISFALLFSLSAYTGEEKPQEELLQLTFSSWNPELKKPQKKTEKKKVVKKTIKPKPKIVKPKVKPTQKPRAAIVEPPKPILNDKPRKNIVEKEKIAEPMESLDSHVAEEILPEPTPIFQLTAMPKFLHKSQPNYPSQLRSSGVEGVVKLQLLIDAQGNVRKISILSSAGDAFDNSAMHAMYKSTFIPAKVNNESVPVLLTMPIKFRLM